MAAIENDHLVVNVVYTGPPLAGKTQSVKALMPLLKGPGAETDVLSPGDWRGRTAFFDWAVYEGGAYNGKSIYCRIISTPGQIALSDRREMLLRAADAVILVIDSQADALERAVQCYEEMAPWLAEASREVPLRLVLQCNKQDLPGSLPPEELTRRLHVPCGNDVYPTSASTGKGLRAAFVAGVRNAVERARALVARGLVLEGPEITSGQDLFERMSRETAPIGSMPPSAAPPAPASLPVAPSPSSSEPAALVRSAREGSGADRPASSRAAARSKAESARPGSNRASSKAPASGASSGSGRSGTTKDARTPGSPFPFGTGKPKSTSGFFPASGARAPASGSSSAWERASTSHPPLPPDHPFASSAPTTRTSKRRQAGGSSRPASGVSADANDKPRSGRPTRASQPSGSSPSVRVDAPARSAHDAGSAATAGKRSDTRPSLTAVASRSASEAAPKLTAALGEPAAATAASLVVASGAASGSAPPSSATASVPASSARRAIGAAPPEPRALPEPSGAAPPAPEWRPGQGPRPPMLPASAHDQLVPAESRAWLALMEAAAQARAEQAAKAARADVDGDAARREERARRAPQPSVPSAPEQPTSAKTFVVGGARPAVMPASAYFAALARAGDAASSSDAGANATSTRESAAVVDERTLRATPVVASGAVSSDTQPAAIPASAWHAGTAAGEATPTRALAADEAPSPRDSAPAGSTRQAAAGGAGDEDPVDSGWPDAGEVLSLHPPFEARMQRSRAKNKRPAMMPTNAGDAPVEAGDRGKQSSAPTSGSAPGDRLGSGELGDDDEWPRPVADDRRPERPGAAAPLRMLLGETRDPGDSQPPLHPSPRRPAVMPASAWRASIEAAAQPEAADVASRAALGDVGRAGSASDVTPTTDAEPPSSGERTASGAEQASGDGPPAIEPPPLPPESRPANDTPTLAPSLPSDRLLSSERPTLLAAAIADADEDAAEPAFPIGPAFADPATFGLESSQLIERPLLPLDESSESFRIPETPPGLQAFVAKARLSTPPPPPPPPGDDVIPSLAPTIESHGEMQLGATGTLGYEPPEFAGPRMPGHVRAPRAVWRRSTWRTLEMHITSDAVALEDARGRWIGELAPGWYARTLRSAGDARSAQRAFAEEVLRERRLGRYLSRPRCVALTEEADRFWVWQAACRVPTLAAVLGRRLAARESPSAMAEALLDASLAFVEARQRFIQARIPLPLSLHALSVQDDELVYSGLLPDPGAVFVHPPSDGQTAFEDALRKKWPSAPVDGRTVFAELSGKAAGRLPEPILAIIRSVVGQSSAETSTNEVSG